MSPFIKVACAIGGHEYLACGQYPLSIGFSLREIADGVTPMLKLKVPLPTLRRTKLKFLARVELETKNNVGSYCRSEHEACIKSLPNGGRLNQVFEVVGIAYGLRPQPCTEAIVEA
jgi:hypothetical protein